MVLTSRLIQLHFSSQAQTSYPIQVNGNVKLMIVKQVTIVNTAGNTPTTPIAGLKCDLITPNQTLCNFPLVTSTNWCTHLNTKFNILNPVVNSTFNFSLVANDQTPINGIANLDVYVNLILEFY